MNFFPSPVPSEVFAGYPTGGAQAHRPALVAVMQKLVVLMNHVLKHPDFKLVDTKVTRKK